MSTTTTNTTLPTKSDYDALAEAILAEVDEAGAWRVADLIYKVAPSGVQAVEQAHAEMLARGVPVKSVNTMRVYRTVAANFPPAERVAGVSFSAHREATRNMTSTEDAKNLLGKLVADHGAGNVSITTVRKAVQAATGKVPAAKAKSSSSQSQSRSTTYDEVAFDLIKGGRQFLGALDGMLALDGVTLDGLHSGLTKVLAEVENRRAKQARKAAAAKKPTTTSPRRTPRKPAAKKAAAKSPAKAAAGKAGDLRGL